MPFMQAFVGRLNTRFNSTNIANVDPSLLAPGKNVADAAEGSKSGAGAINATPAEKAYVTNFSAADLEALRGVLYWAVTQKPRVPVQFLWVPGAAYKVEWWNVAGTATSGGGISVLLRGPSPANVTAQYP